jgi:hypothetical protein
MADNTTLSDFLAELGVDINNMQEFLLKLNEMLTTPNPSVTFTQTSIDANGNPVTQELPVQSHSYLSNRVTDIDNKFNSLLNANGNRVQVISNGITKSFELQDISAVIKDLNSVKNKAVTVPTNFNTKTNWFFESFLSPLIYINLDVSTLITSDVDKFEITRIIIPNTPAAIEYFDNTYTTGQDNLLLYSTVLNNLSANGIPYTIDVNEQSLPPVSSKKSGTFNIFGVTTDFPIGNIAGQAAIIPRNIYTFNQVNYTEYVEGTVGSIQKTLAINDILITSDNSEYRITSIQPTPPFLVGLTKIYGNQAITTEGIGSVLSIKPDLLTNTNLQVNVGFNERQILFFRPISTRLKVTTAEYSQGFAIYTNDLKIQSLGTELTLAQYYQNFISDFSLLFTEYSKEKKIPASIGVIPTAPTLSAAQFIVSQDNDHIKQDTDVNNVKAQIASLATIKTQIEAKDAAINTARTILNTNDKLTPKAKADNLIEQKRLTDERATLSTQYSSTISTITTAISTVPALIKPPVYSVKGMWAIPAASPSPDGYGLQEIVQFKVSYRVLSSSGQAAGANQISIQNADGSTSTGSFSPSKEIITKARSKVYNSATGFYQWAVENIADSNIVNSNQIEIPIGKGETIEIKIKSLSEAGWPDSPVESVFSNIITIPFPENLEVVEDASVISQRIFAEEAKINFKTELTAQGLDLHLGTAFSQADKYYAHRAEDIASGFFSTNGGGIINLFSKLQTISNTIESIQNTLASGTGTLKVSIIEGTNQITVNNGQTIELDAGNYKDQIQNGIKLDHGNIITRQYIIQLENTSQTALQLISALNGALGQIATISNPINSPSEPYHTSLRYDLSPLVINSNLAGTIGGFKQVNGYQSSQAKGQIIYNRAKSVDLSNNLIEGDRIALTPQDPDNISYNTTDTEYINYNYQGNVINGTTVPYALGHYLPFDPTLATLTIQKNSLPNQLSVNPTVWNGTLDQNQAPVGYGILSEFCISIENPAIKVNGAYHNNWNEIYRPTNQATLTSQKTLPFSHAIHFETSENEIFNAFGAKHFQQAAYRLPVAPTPANQLLTFKEINSPIKTSFNDNDKYLIGKYTCGSYLFISPSSYQAIGSNAVSPTITKRTVEFGTPNAIQIPLKFQYRASDYLANIGGYRPNETLTNIRYSKKLGLDIYLKDETFSFDILAKVKYQSETASVTPLSPIAQSGAISQSDLVAVVGGG